MVLLDFALQRFNLLFIAMASRSLLIKYIQIGLVVALYWVVSITTVFVNKSLLSNNEIDVPYFVLWFQCLVSVIICVLMKKCTSLVPDGSPFSREAVFNVLPVSLLLASMVVFNGLCIKHAGVAFYYIGRSLTTIFNVICTYIILHEKVSSKTVMCCGLIVFGFVLGVDQEKVLGSFSLIGTLSGLLGSLSLALYSVFNKKVLPFLNSSIWLLSYYTNLYSCVILLPFVCFNGEIMTLINSDKLLDLHFWLLMTIGGVLGFSIGYVSSLQIKVTSPLTHNISGTAKACVQTLIATHWYDERKNFLWWLSNYVVLIGSFAYALVRQKEMEVRSTSSDKKSEKKSFTVIRA